MIQTAWLSLTPHLASARCPTVPPAASTASAVSPCAPHAGWGQASTLIAKGQLSNRRSAAPRPARICSRDPQPSEPAHIKTDTLGRMKHKPASSASGFLMNIFGKMFKNLAAQPVFRPFDDPYSIGLRVAVPWARRPSGEASVEVLEPFYSCQARGRAGCSVV